MSQNHQNANPPTQKQIDKARWKQRTYLTGGLVGFIGGVIGAYLFTRSAEDEIDRNGVPNKISSAQILGLSLAVIALLRQITDLGKPPQDNRRR